MDADDTRFVIDRLDRQHVDDIAKQARAAWDGGATVFELCYQPGDATHYALLFTIVTPNAFVIGAPGGGSGGGAE